MCLGEGWGGRERVSVGRRDYLGIKVQQLDNVRPYLALLNDCEML
jgi:hypothetical protein